MSKSFDIHLLPLARQMGREIPHLPGLYASSPPPRAARSRRSDYLILYLGIEGNAPLTQAHEKELLKQLTQVYYSSSGSVTAAMREVAETLNRALLERNLSSSSTGRQAVGLLSQLVIRGQQLYLAQSGPVHAFVLKADEIEHFYDAVIAGRGLGLGRTTPVNYSRTLLAANDSLILSVQPAKTWRPNTLIGLHGQGPESIRRRLLGRSDSDLQAVLVQTRPGKGKIYQARSQPVASTGDRLKTNEAGQETPIARPISPLGLPTLEELESSSHSTPPADLEQAHAPVQHAEPEISAGEQALPEVQTQEREPNQVRETAVPPPSVEGPAAEAEPSPEALPVPAATGVAGESLSEPQTASQSAQFMETFDGEAESAAYEKGPSRFSELGPLLSAFFRPLSSLGRAGLNLLKAVLRFLLPDEAFFSLPASVMAFIAIAVPIVFVAVAGWVYIRQGEATQFQVRYTQAEEAALQADTLEDPVAQREQWLAALALLDQAENYGRTANSDALRDHIQQEIDVMDNVKRPVYQPALLSELPDAVRITRMLLIGNDLYMLDGASGNVLRGMPSGNGYQIDPSFQCGPDFPGGSNVGPLIDITPAPANDPETVLVGMDAQGNVLRCFLQDPQEAALLNLPLRTSEGDLVGFTQEMGNFYVLDPAAQAVWIYWDGAFDQEPEFFFGATVPNLDATIDITAERFDVYLLQVDGTTTLCTYSALDVSPTRCSEPAPYIDQREGHTGEIFVPPDRFSQVLFTQPPDPSLYFLAPDSMAIYHFSLRSLVYQRRFLPYRPLGGGQATAFAVDQLDRVLFLAVGNKVYLASMP